MTSLRHMPSEPMRADDALLDAARASILAVGWRRSTLTDVARRAGVSRMTLYRRWPDMATLLADVMTREWSVPGWAAPASASAPLARLVDLVAGTVAALRENELFAKILQVDPELLLPYLLDRRGRTQDALLAVLGSAVADGQADGSVRAGDPVLLSRAVLLAAHGFALSAATMTGPGGPGIPGASGASPGPTTTDLDGELRLLVERYLAA